MFKLLFARSNRRPKFQEWNTLGCKEGEEEEVCFIPKYPELASDQILQIQPKITHIIEVILHKKLVRSPKRNLPIKKKLKNERIVSKSWQK